jgi:hypothetical protein
MRFPLSVLAIGIAACAPSARTIDTTPIPVTENACPNPYVEIVNHTSKPLEIYGYVGGGPVLLGEVSSTATRMTLMGTPMERQSGAMYAQSANGQRLSGGAGNAKSSGSVQLTRKCGKAD